MRLVSRAVGASWLAFYSVDARQNLHDFVLVGVPREFHRCYEREMFAYDPLHARKIATADPRIARMGDAAQYASAEDVNIYSAFLRRFAVSEATELLFYDEQGIRAGLNVTWRDRDPPPTAASRALAEHLQRYIEFALRTRCARASHEGECSRAEPSQGFGLTPREREVARLACLGHTNAMIASGLGVRVSTVKTHLLHIYEKCQVKTRAGLVARLSGRAAIEWPPPNGGLCNR